MKSILFFALQTMTNEEREKVLYHSVIDDHQKNIIIKCLVKLFGHPMWDEPEGELDTMLISSQKQEDLFNKRGLTEKYVYMGHTK